MAFWIGLAVLGFVVTVLIVESRPVRRRLESRSSSSHPWYGGWFTDAGSGSDCHDGGGWGGGFDGGGGGGDGGGGC
jgi:hypothetical protein